MSEQEIITGLLMNGNNLFSFVEVCQRCQISENMLMDWLSHGLLGEEVMPLFTEVKFDSHMIERILTAHRLQHDLEVNIQGVILALELLDQITEMQVELAILKRS